MKKILINLSIIILATGALNSISQNDSVFAKRQETADKLDDFRASITDSSLDMMKKMVVYQNQLIELDKQIVYDYVDSIVKQNDSLKKSGNIKAAFSTSFASEINKKDNYIFYGVIIFTFIFLLCVLFAVLYFRLSGRSNKLIKQFEEIEKAKKANRDLIELAKKEVDALRKNAEKDIAISSESVLKEAKLLQQKNDMLTAEKNDLEKKITEKGNECANLLLQLRSMKETYERMLKENTSADFTEEKLMLEKQVSEKESRIEALLKQNFDLNNDFSARSAIISDLEANIKNIQEKLLAKEKELHDVLTGAQGELDNLKKENLFLKEEISQLNEEIKKELVQKKIMESEIRRFINELKKSK